ncbi:MAG: copper chaperone PCu(A)C [Burkholderiales bacterium]|jgi:copper(I)-binding protein
MIRSKLSSITLLLCALVLPIPVLAQVVVKDPWVRATVPGQKATGAFMTLTATTPQALVDVRSPAAGIVELHEMKMEDGVMRMRAIPSLALPAGQGVALSPGGYHVMLIDIKRELNPGQTVPITLIIEGPDRLRRSIEIQAPVLPLNARSAGQGSGGSAPHQGHGTAPGPSGHQGHSNPQGQSGHRH